MRPHALLSCFLLLGFLLRPSSAGVTSATFYNPPYLPTACFGTDRNQFPVGNMFVAVSGGLWDNGAACGRRYMIRCINGGKPHACKSGTITVRVVDRASTLISPPAVRNTAFVLPTLAYNVISSSSVPSINVEFVEA